MRDGKRLIYEARLGFLRDPSDGHPDDWWVVSLEDLSQTKTGFWPAAAAMGLREAQLGITPDSWLGSDDRIVFSARLGQSVDLWTVAISPDSGKALGDPKRLTAGGLDDTQPASSVQGRIVFTSGETRERLWTVDLADRSGTDRPERVSSGVADEADPMLTRDSRNVLFVRNESAWLRELATGNESIVAQESIAGALISPDGSSVVYRGPDDATNLKADVRGGPAAVVCSGCGWPADWSRDGTSILITTGPPDSGRALLVDVASSESSLLVEHPEFTTWNHKFSPDGRWVAFHVTIAPDLRQVFVASIDGERPVPVDSWIPVTDAETNCAKPVWSPEGDRIYYLSDLEGTYCLYSQPFDSNSKPVAGPPTAVHHFHDPRWSIPSITSLRYEVHEDRLIVPLTERTGNVWMLEPNETE